MIHVAVRECWPWSFLGSCLDSLAKLPRILIPQYCDPLSSGNTLDPQYFVVCLEGDF